MPWYRTTAWIGMGVAAISSVCAQPTAAQDASAKARTVAGHQSSIGAIYGVVVDTSGASLPLVGVVMLDAPYTQVRTNRGGGYHIDSVAPGTHLLRFRRIGLVPTTVTVTVHADDVTGVDVIMATMPQMLAAISIQDTLGEVMHLPPDVLDRMRNGVGSYITAADIERRHPTRTSQMLQYVTGVEVTRDGTVNNTRGFISLKTVPCKYGMPVYIDGAKIADPHIGADSLHGTPLTDYVPPGDVAVIEVYRGAGELPAALPQNPCGGLFIWTKRR